MKSRSPVSLDEHFAAFVDNQIAEGNYASPTDVIHAGLRLLEEEKTKLSALRDALVDGENSGESMPFDFDEFLARKRGSEASVP